jgi:hypothetical protein
MSCYQEYKVLEVGWSVYPKVWRNIKWQPNGKHIFFATLWGY